MHSYSPARKDNKAIAFTSLNGHSYFYDSARHVAKRSFETNMFRTQKRVELPAFSEWQPWAGEVAAGTFFHDDLKALRRNLLVKDLDPKVSLRSMAEYSQSLLTR